MQKVIMGDHTDSMPTRKARPVVVVVLLAFFAGVLNALGVVANVATIVTTWRLCLPWICTSESEFAQIIYDPTLPSTGYVALPQHVVGSGIPDSLLAVLDLLPSRGRRIESVAIGQDGSWVILHDSGFVQHRAPASLTSFLTQHFRSPAKPIQVWMGAPAGGWLVLLSDGTLHPPAAPTAAHFPDSIIGFASSATTRILLTASGEYRLTGDIPHQLRRLLSDRSFSVRSVALSDSGKFLAVGGNGRCEHNGLPLNMLMQVNTLCEHHLLRYAAFAAGSSGWVVIGKAPETPLLTEVSR